VATLNFLLNFSIRFVFSVQLFTFIRVAFFYKGKFRGRFGQLHLFLCEEIAAYWRLFAGLVRFIFALFSL